MKMLAVVLALVFFVVGLAYGMGWINVFTKSGEAHQHHITHLVVAWVLSLLCMVWYRFQSNNS